MNEKVSVIIPARNEIYLEPTIRNVLYNAEGDVEVVVVLDGYEPDPPLKIKDPRLIIDRQEKAIGQRAAINHGVRICNGKYIMKLDAHCAVGKGFDVILKADCEPDWTVIPRMYNLDVETFKPRYFDNFNKAVRQRKLHDYLYIYVNERKELRTQYYPSHINRKLHHERKNILIDETMSCMGPGFFMHKDRFWDQGGCDENHEGGWGQQAVEVACKAWLSGGKLMVNKKTWFAHWFRGKIGWPYPITGNQISRVRAYSKDLWLNDKWPRAERKFEWMLDKFGPPGWENYNGNGNGHKPKQVVMDVEPTRLGPPPGEFAGIGDYPTDEEKELIFRKMYWHIFKRSNFVRWQGHITLKMPNDLMLYQRAIRDFYPDLIIETGTHTGGTAIFLADIMEMNKRGEVVTIDKRPRSTPKHDRVTYLEGSSTSKRIINKVKKMAVGKRVMVILDSDHSERHVTEELAAYAPLVTKNQFLVIEDCWGKYGEGNGPFGEHNGPLLAKNKFMKDNVDFEQTDYHDRYLVGITMGGWLKRV